MKKFSLIIALVSLVTLALFGCKSNESSLKKVVVACSPTPHTEIMNDNYAVEAGYKSSDALYLEKQDSVVATTNANIVCVKDGNENADFAVALKECIKSDTVKSFIENKYEKSVIYID